MGVQSISSVLETSLDRPLWKFAKNSEKLKRFRPAYSIPSTIVWTGEENSRREDALSKFYFHKRWKCRIVSLGQYISLVAIGIERKVATSYLFFLTEDSIVFSGVSLHFSASLSTASFSYRVHTSYILIYSDYRINVFEWCRAYHFLLRRSRACRCFLPLRSERSVRLYHWTSASWLEILPLYEKLLFLWCSLWSSDPPYLSNSFLNSTPRVRQPHSNSPKIWTSDLEFWWCRFKVKSTSQHRATLRPLIRRTLRCQDSES